MSPYTPRLLRELRTVIVAHAAACYRRGVADASGKPETAEAEMQVIRELNEQMHRLLNEIRDNLEAK